MTPRVGSLNVYNLSSNRMQVRYLYNIRSRTLDEIVACKTRLKKQRDLFPLSDG